jgi:hypothetical protein
MNQTVATRKAEGKVLELSLHTRQLQSRTKKEVVLVVVEVGWRRESLMPRSRQGAILAYFE